MEEMVISPGGLQEASGHPWIAGGTWTWENLQPVPTDPWLRIRDLGGGFEVTGCLDAMVGDARKVAPLNNGSWLGFVLLRIFPKTNRRKAKPSGYPYKSPLPSGKLT